VDEPCRIASASVVVFLLQLVKHFKKPICPMRAVLIELENLNVAIQVYGDFKWWTRVIFQIFGDF